MIPALLLPSMFDYYCLARYKPLEVDHRSNCGEHTICKSSKIPTCNIFLRLYEVCADTCRSVFPVCFALLRFHAYLPVR